MDERVKRIKAKLKAYGSYTREILQLQKRLQEIEEAIAWHIDWPEQAAKECGIHASDPKHPAVQQMIVEQASLEREIDQAYTERQRLGLDQMLRVLNSEDRRILELVYVDDLSLQAVAPRCNLSKSGLRDRIDAICKSPHACG